MYSPSQTIRVMLEQINFLALQTVVILNADVLPLAQLTNQPWNLATWINIFRLASSSTETYRLNSISKKWGREGGGGDDKPCQSSDNIHRPYEPGYSKPGNDIHQIA